MSMLGLKRGSSDEDMKRTENCWQTDIFDEGSPVQMKYGIELSQNLYNDNNFGSSPCMPDMSTGAAMSQKYAHTFGGEPNPEEDNKLLF